MFPRYELWVITRHEEIEDCAMGSSSTTTAVFLLAQNRLLREALTRMLDKKSDISVVGACALSPTSLEEVAQKHPDVLLVDSSASGDAVREFLRELHRVVPDLKMVMIGMDADEQSFLRAVRQGAVGYVLKDASAVDVVSAVRAVANGEAVCPSKLCICLFQYVAHQCSHLPSFQTNMALGLTNREQQLVLLIGRGLTNKEIASQLQLAEQTVRNHVHRMIRKVGATNRLAVVELCRVQGLPV